MYSSALIKGLRTPHLASSSVSGVDDIGTSLYRVHIAGASASLGIKAFWLCY